MTWQHVGVELGDASITENRENRLSHLLADRHFPCVMVDVDEPDRTHLLAICLCEQPFDPCHQEPEWISVDLTDENHRVRIDESIAKGVGDRFIQTVSDRPHRVQCRHLFFELSVEADENVDVFGFSEVEAWVTDPATGKLTQRTAVEAPGDAFMEVATQLDIDQIGVAMNQPETIAYVIRATGFDRNAWREWDATQLVCSVEKQLPILIHQGADDNFLGDQLKPGSLEQACICTHHPLEVRMQEGYDHSYYFIASFIDDHLRYHAKALGLLV